MEHAIPRPYTINKLRFAVDSALAMLVGMQLDVFTPLKDGPMTADQVAKAIGVRPNRMGMLLYALVSTGLLEVKDGFFTNIPEGSRYLVKGSPHYLNGMDSRLARQWKMKLMTAESIRTGVPQAKIDFSHSPQEEVEAFLRGISTQTVETAGDLVKRCDFSSVRTIADIGGGAGGLAITVARACPSIQATIVDLPEVTPISQKVVEEEGLTDRVQVLAADVVERPLRGSYDAAVLKTMVQVLSSEDAQKMLVNVSKALNPGGTIYIVGQILDNSRTSPPEAMSYNLAFINHYDVGESYTEQQHRDWLSEAGFVDIHRAKFFLRGEYGLMTARKPA